MQFDMPRTEITFAADYLDLPIRQNEETLEDFESSTGPTSGEIQKYQFTDFTNP